MKGSDAVPARRPIRVWPDRRRFTIGRDGFHEWRSGIARGHAPRQRAYLGRKGIADAVQQKFEQRGAIEPVLKFRPLDEIRGAGAFDGVVHL